MGCRVLISGVISTFPYKGCMVRGVWCRVRCVGCRVWVVGCDV